MINAGHTLSGAACGTVAIKSESLETRKIVSIVKDKLKADTSIELVDCTLDSAMSYAHYSHIITDMANVENADLFVSVEFAHSNGHLDSGSLIYIKDASIIDEATCLYKYMEADNFDASIQNGNSVFSFIDNAVAPKVIIFKVCHIDSVGDMKKYNVDSVANALVKSITKSKPSDGWYYDNSTDAMSYYKKSVVQTGIVSIGTNGYYFDKDGSLQIGLFSDASGNTLMSDNRGRLYKNQWVINNRRLFYVKGDYTLAIPGENEEVISLEIDGVTYTFSKEGCVEYIRSINGDHNMSIYTGSNGNRYPYIEGVEILST